jgi:hypothetical protein
MKTKHYFFAPLSNLRGRADLLEIGPGLHIERWNYRKTIQSISNLLQIPTSEIDVDLESSNCFLTMRRYSYVLVGEYELAIPSHDQTDPIIQWHNEIDNIFQKIDSSFSLIRLYLGGNIRPYGHFCYTIEDDKQELVSSVRYSLLNIGHSCVITQRSAELANIFLANTSCPLKPDYLQLAFDNLELSKETYASHLQFLCLMIALESIFNMGENEITYRVSRNAAVLLGKSSSSSEKIMKGIQSLYKKRSSLVHSGKIIGISQMDIFWAEHYVRESILALIQLNMPKDILSKALTNCGFGQWHV